jgi:hypothetical protein
MEWPLSDIRLRWTDHRSEATCPKELSLRIDSYHSRTFTTRLTRNYTETRSGQS